MKFTSAIVEWDYKNKYCEIIRTLETDNKNEHDAFVSGAEPFSTEERYCLDNSSLEEKIWQYYKFIGDKQYHNAAARMLVDAFPEIAVRMKAEVDSAN